MDSSEFSTVKVRSIDSLKRIEEKMKSALLSKLATKSSDQINILLAEDSNDDYFFISDALEKSEFKYRLDWVCDGAQVLEWLEEASLGNRLPDLLLLDINMPKLNGNEVLKELRSNPKFKNLLIIMLSNSKSPRDIQKSYDHGANSFIVKNSNFKEFVQVINSMIQFWFKTAKIPARS